MTAIKCGNRFVSSLFKVSSGLLHLFSPAAEALQQEKKSTSILPALLKNPVPSRIIFFSPGDRRGSEFSSIKPYPPYRLTHSLPSVGTDLRGLKRFAFLPKRGLI